MNAISELKQNISSQVEPYLKPWLEKALDRWEELNNREQLILMALSATIVFALMFSLFVVPLIKGRNEAKEYYEAKVELLSWMQSVAPGLSGMGKNKDPLNAQGMMNTVNQNAAAYQLRLDRVQPEGANKLRVWLEDVPFNAFMQWVNDLHLNEGIIVSSVSIDPESSPGLISAKVVLQGN